MITYALDFESFYDSECSITTLGPAGYFSHPSFEAYMVTVVGDDGYVYAGCPREFDWSMLNGHTVLSHNASFDESLYLHGVNCGWFKPCTPAEWHCTADMVAYLGLPRSLKNASATLFDIKVDKTTRDNMKGLQWSSMSEEFRKEVTQYAIVDSQLCLRIWKTLHEQWPQVERDISRMNRKICQRGLPIDVKALRENIVKIGNTLFDAERSIPWIGDATPLSRKAFNAQCRKQGIDPPKSLAAGNEDADKWFAAHQQDCPWARSVQDYRRINMFQKKLQAFDYGTMPDDRYYGGLMYCGANPTARFSGSGGNLNLQNLPREEMFGVNFRHMIKPKAGNKLIVADLSQIEVRTLSYLAGDKRALDMIRNAKDIYHAFGVLLGLHDPANGELKDYDKGLRQRVKAMVLGCFEPDTLVLTEYGWKPILYLETQDRVWDGVEWVNHNGIICQGEQETIRQHGVGVTEDHEILTEDGWLEWCEVATNPSLTESAVRSVTLPCSNGLTKIGHGIRECGVNADGLVLWTETTSKREGQLGATRAPNRNQRKPIGGTADTKISSPTTTLDSDFLTVFRPASTDATTQMTQLTGIMGGVEYTYSHRGGGEGRSSSPISLPSKGGMTLNYNSTGSTMIEVTSQKTYDLSPDLTICKTAGPFMVCRQELPNSKRRSVVYDVSFAGPRNRFTILTDAGPMVVHNCGYGIGAARFAEFSGMSLEEAEQAVRTYRLRMKSVVNYWAKLNQELVTACALGVPFELELPSARILRYGKLRKMKALGDRFAIIGKMYRMGGMRDIKLYGGTLAENASQGLARDIFSDMMLRIDAAGYPIILHVHDEVVCEVPEAIADEALSNILNIMSTPPDWIPDIPVAAEGHILDLYAK